MLTHFTVMYLPTNILTFSQMKHDKFCLAEVQAGDFAQPRVAVCDPADPAQQWVWRPVDNFTPVRADESQNPPDR